MVDDLKKNKGNEAPLLRPNVGGVWLFYVCSIIFALVAYPARAENTPDPTRPPPEFEAPAPSSAAAPAAVPNASILQSVLISPRHKVAIINGETVTLGGKYGTAKVVKISESGVVLNEGGNLQTLRLFPSVEKKISPTGEAAVTAGKKLPHGKRNAVRNGER